MLGAQAFWIGKQLVLRQHLDRVQRELFRFLLLILLVAEAFWKTYSVFQWFMKKRLCKEAAANLFGILVVYEEKVYTKRLLPTYLGFQ